MMHALKTPAFLRPSSRPSSPAPVPAAVPATPSRPDSGIGFERNARPLNKLSLSTFRRPSPAPAPAANPAPLTLIQDGSYLETLSLKLSEAVSKALAQPTGPATANEHVGGKRPIPAGRGRALGALISSELQATRDNPHLQRAIIRSLHRPLSVLVSNLSAQLLPLLSSAAFLIPPAPTQQNPLPNPTQLHAIALATCAGEVLDMFDERGLGLDHGDIRGDGLKGIREGLVSLVDRVVNPLVGGIRNEMIPLLESLEKSNTAPATSKAANGAKAAPVPHPAIVTLQGVVPVYAKALPRYCATSKSQSALATFLIAVLWRGVVALAHRQPPPPTPPASPAAPLTSLKKLHRLSSNAVPQVAPPMKQTQSTPPASRFTIKLPGPPSRPPSPPSVQGPASAAQDARALFDLLDLFPRPAEGQVAREAVDDAFDGLRALAAFLEAVQSAHATLPSTDDPAALQAALAALTADLPTLIALPALLTRYGGAHTPSVAEMLGLSEREYRGACLAGFGRADECATAVAQRVIGVLAGSAPVVEQWLVAEIKLAEEEALDEH